MESINRPTPATDKGEMVPVFNLINSQTELPVEVGGPDSGDDLVVTAFVTFTEEPKFDGETVTRTITVTTGTEQGTVTVTMDPGTLATIPVMGSLPQTVTATVTALPHGKVCTTIGTAAGVPIACFFGAGALMLGICLWLQRRNRNVDKRRRDSATSSLAISDSSFEDPAAPVPYARNRGRHSIDGGPGTMAPPPSLDAHADGPFADPSSPQHSRTSVFRTASQNRNISRRDSYLHDYSDIGPQSSPESDTSWAPLRYGFRRRYRVRGPINGEMAGEPRRALMNSGEVCAFENDPSGRTRFPHELRTAVHTPSNNDDGDVGPVIRPAQTGPLRPTEVAGGGYVSQRASIIDDPDYVTPPHSPSLTAAGTEEPAEWEAGPVTRGLSSIDKGKGKAKADGSVSENEDDDADAVHLGKNSPFELPADNPIHELSTDGAIATFNKSGQNDDDDKSADKSVSRQDSGTRNGDRPAAQ